TEAPDQRKESRRLFRRFSASSRTFLEDSVACSAARSTLKSSGSSFAHWSFASIPARWTLTLISSRKVLNRSAPFFNSSFRSSSLDMVGASPVSHNSGREEVHDL